jgi:hypothetical protein
MDTTSHPADTSGRDRYQELLEELDAVDASAAPQVAAQLAADLTQELETLDGGPEPEQLRAEFAPPSPEDPI